MIWRKRAAPMIAASALLLVTTIGSGAEPAAPASRSSTAGAVRAFEANPFYFQDAAGKPVVMIGDYTWQIFSDPDYDYDALFAWLKARGLNICRVWLWWGTDQFPEEKGAVYLWPHSFIQPYLRTGPGNATDGRPKYDLTRFNPAFFDRLRGLCLSARDHGVFLQLTTMDAWMLKHPELWRLHAYHRDNNVNGVDGDPRNIGEGTDGGKGFCSMGNPKALEFQKAYLRRLVEAVKDFDNVYFEIANENFYSAEWELTLCDYLHECEANTPRRHLAMPRDLPSHKGVVQEWDPAAVHAGMLAKRSLRRPLLFDTDWTINNNDGEVRKAMWTAVLSGGHFDYMDDSLEFRREPVKDRRADLHRQIGFLAAFIRQIKPWEMNPDESAVRKGRCFVMASSTELAAYAPEGGRMTLDLTAVKDARVARWYNPREGKFGDEFNVHGGVVEFVAPDGKDWALLVQ